MRTKLKPRAFANYWHVDIKKRKDLQTAYWMLCVGEDIEQEEMGEEDCNCGSCYTCWCTKMFTMPEYEMPLM